MNFKIWIFSKIFFKDRLHRLKEKKNFYAKIKTPQDIYTYQLEKFNEVWQNAYKQIPFYKLWKEQHQLPDRISQLHELKYFPVLTKKDIQKNQTLIFEHLENFQLISTGGSTGEPVKFPTSQQEREEIYAGLYLARSWWGFKPFDKVAIFWGHSHLFGSGLRGKINQIKRRISDWLVNSKRFNAYDTSFSTLSRYTKELKNYNPNWIIGYTSTIYKLAKFIQENSIHLNLTNLQGVIVTSETVTSADLHIIENAFKVPCIIEYGMAETGVIAYAKSNSHTLQLLWDSFIGITQNNILNVTSLDARHFPLINYQTDDCIQSDDEISIIHINSISGRKKDILNIATSTSFLELSGILMVHILKNYPNIYDVQFQQLPNNVVKILFTSPTNLPLIDVKTYFLENIKIDHPDILDKSIIFEQIEEITKSIAGKISLIQKV